MSDIENSKEINDPGQGHEIDLVEIICRIWEQRKKILIWCGCAAILGLVVAFSIPKEYSSYVTLVPESQDSPSGGALGGLAALAGINKGANGEDAMLPEVYPDIISSVPFQLALLDIPLTNSTGSQKFTLEEFITNDIKSPWWSSIIGLPGTILSLLKSSDESDTSIDTGDSGGPIKITEEQEGLIGYIGEAVSASVDQKTSIIYISVTTQDPVVAATLADTVANRLQEFIISYRTQKARQDLEFTEKLNDEAKQKYYAAQQKYANYLDSHQGLVLYSAQTMRDRLENEATLAFNVYNQTSQRLELAKAKVQEQTPVFATIEPAIVPIRASKPRKPLILIAFVFLGFAASVSWIIFAEPFIATFRRKLKHSEAVPQE